MSGSGKGLDGVSNTGTPDLFVLWIDGSAGFLETVQIAGGNNFDLVLQGVDNLLLLIESNGVVLFSSLGSGLADGFHLGTLM